MSQESNRLAAFKNRGKDSDAMRRRRYNTSIELRKASRDDQILKRRNVALVAPSSPEDNSPNCTTSMTIQEIVDCIKSNDPSRQLEGVQQARRILSRERNPPINLMIEAGIVPHCVNFLTHGNSPELQFEACWALTNIASGTSEQTMAVIKENSIPRLVGLVSSPHEKLAEQAVWALGNIAGDGSHARDLVLEADAAAALIKRAYPETSGISLLRNVVWTISNLCRNKNPVPPFRIVRMFLPALHRMLFVEDNDVLADTCWALSYLTDGPNNQIQEVVDSGIVPRLVSLLAVDHVPVLTPTLRAVGNIVTGNEDQTDTVIAAGALHHFRRLLANGRSNIVKETAWSISNVTAGNADQIQAVIDADILPPLIKILKEGDFKSQKEAAWAVTNFTSGAKMQQLSLLIQLNVLPPLCALLDSKDHRTVTVVLDALHNILINADKVGQLEATAILIEECGGVDKLEQLQHHDNEQVYLKALNMIDTYFTAEGDDNSVAPPAQHENQYNFNPVDQSGQFNF